MPAEVLRLHDVGVRRDQSMLLRNVSWTVHDDERWVVVGPNGAGKTTLLQVASGLIVPTQGSADVLGESLAEADLADLRSRIGLASAAVAELVPHREKVIDLVMTAGYGTIGRSTEDFDSFDVARAVELLDLMGCAHLIRRKFGTLSEGERKRVQIARSLMADPELLLLDEPAAGLDLGGREDLLSRIAALVLDPRAPVFVLVTHHVEEVPAGVTHALLMRGGAVLAAGPRRGLHRAESVSVLRAPADRGALGRPLDGPSGPGPLVPSRPATRASAPQPSPSDRRVVVSLLVLGRGRCEFAGVAQEAESPGGRHREASGFGVVLVSDGSSGLGVAGIGWVALRRWRSLPQRSRQAPSTPSSDRVR